MQTRKRKFLDSFCEYGFLLFSQILCCSIRIFLRFFDNQSWIDAIEIALRIFGALPDVFVFALIESLDALSLAFAEIIRVYFIAEVAQNKEGNH